MKWTIILLDISWVKVDSKTENKNIVHINKIKGIHNKSLNIWPKIYIKKEKKSQPQLHLLENKDWKKMNRDSNLNAKIAIFNLIKLEGNNSSIWEKKYLIQEINKKRRHNH